MFKMNLNPDPPYIVSVIEHFLLVCIVVAGSGLVAYIIF